MQQSMRGSVSNFEAESTNDVRDSIIRRHWRLLETKLNLESVQQSPNQIQELNIESPCELGRKPSQ
jgi:hypothetical protein